MTGQLIERLGVNELAVCRLKLVGEDGRVYGGMGFDPDGSPFLGLGNPDTDQPVAYLTVDKRGPAVAVRAPASQAAAVLRMFQDGRPAIVLFDPAGTPRFAAALDAANQVGVRAWDAAGKEVGVEQLWREDQAPQGRGRARRRKTPPAARKRPR